METPDERILVIWLVATLAVASAIGVGVGVADALFVGVGAWVGPTAFVLATFLGSLYAALRFRTFRFECSQDTLYLERGVFVQVRSVVPVTYVRRVDVRRRPFERLVGLDRLVVYTVGSRRSTVTIPGLQTDRARTLQDQLRSGSPAGIPTAGDDTPMLGTRE